MWNYELTFKDSDLWYYAICWRIPTDSAVVENTDGLGSRHSNYCKNSDAKYLVGLGKKLIPIHQTTKEILSKYFL